MPELEDEDDKGIEKAESGEDEEPVPEATGETGSSATKTPAPKIEEVS